MDSFHRWRPDRSRKTYVAWHETRPMWEWTDDWNPQAEGIHSVVRDVSEPWRQREEVPVPLGWLMDSCQACGMQGGARRCGYMLPCGRRVFPGRTQRLAEVRSASVRARWQRNDRASTRAENLVRSGDVANWHWPAPVNFVEARCRIRAERIWARRDLSLPAWWLTSWCVRPSVENLAF
jgi:hypothetical protein